MRKQAEVKRIDRRKPFHPEREVISREEELRRFRRIEEWRRAHFEEFQKRHARVRDPN